jgi:hypothetical protein
MWVSHYRQGPRLFQALSETGREPEKRRFLAAATVSRMREAVSSL